MEKSKHILEPSPLNIQRLDKSVPQRDPQIREQKAEAQRNVYGGEISDDELDLNTDSTTASYRDISLLRIARPSKLMKVNLQGRRPLHACGHRPTNPEKSSGCCRLSIPKTSPRQKAAPYQSSLRKEIKPDSSDHEDDSVEFVREIKACPNSYVRKMPIAGRINVTITDVNQASGVESAKEVSEASISTRTNTDEECPNAGPSVRCKNPDHEMQDSQNHNGIDHNTELACQPGLVETGAGAKNWENTTEHLEVDDDLVVVASAHGNDQNMDFATLHRIVTAVVCHYVEENTANELTLSYVLGRLKSLHHRDFYDRFSEVEYCTRKALERCETLKDSKALQKIRPGITNADIDTLSPDNWLNDVIINQYMKLLLMKDSDYGALSSFWHDELLREKEPSLPDRWEELSCILVPTCADSHWSLLCYYPPSNNVEMYSSLMLSETEVEYAQRLIKFFTAKTRKDGGGQCFVISDLPRQENEYDCGVYVCMFARCIVCGNSFTIVPQQVCDFREWLKKEILKGQVFCTRNTEDSEDD